ncbi:MAG: CRISPR-associated helicase Cas3' [Conexivisphaera sp.]
MRIRGIEIFAKSRPRPKPGEDGHWLLLDDHTQRVLLALDKALNAMKDYEWFKGSPLLSDHEVLETAFTAALLHDIGKVNPRFQSHMRKLRKCPDDELSKIFGKLYMWPDIRHEEYSFVYSRMLYHVVKEKPMAKMLAHASLPVLLHHYNEEYSSPEKGISKVLDKRVGSNDKTRLIAGFLVNNADGVLGGFVNVVEGVSENLSYGLLRSAASNIVGILNEARGALKSADKEDLAASSTAFSDLSDEFGLTKGWGVHVGDKARLVLGLLMRADHFASGSLGLRERDVEPEMPPLDPAARVREEFHDSWQEELIKGKGLQEGNLCLVAPTGSGKTEFALLRNGLRKLVYTLPVRVALNDLYTKRFVKYFGENSVGLLHSTGFLTFSDSKDDEKEDERILEFALLSRNLSYPMILSTPDQVLLSSLGYHGHEKLMTYAPYSHIVIDEIQAYNPKMLAIILRSTSYMVNLGAKLTVITATLVPFAREKLQDLGISIVDVGAPDVSLSTGVKNLRTKRHRVRVERASQGEMRDKIASLAMGAIKRGIRRLLVVVNTVPTAIDVYRKIKELAGNDACVLLAHSRLVERRKDTIMKVVHGWDSSKPLILVATQVVEASVDFDADCLITELSSADSLVQRMGRVYRNRSSDYEGEEANVVVIAADGAADRSNIYDAGVLKKTLETLEGYEGRVLDYLEEKRLVEEVFSDEELRRKYEKEYSNMLRIVEMRPARSKGIAQQYFRNYAGGSFCILNLLSDDVRCKLMDEGARLSMSDRREIYLSSFNLPWFVWNSYRKLLSDMRAEDIRWRWSNMEFLEVKREHLYRIVEEGVESLLMDRGSALDEREWEAV